VLGSKVGGLQEHVAVGGRLVEDFRNPDAWVRAIHELDDSDVYDDCSRNAREYIETHFDNDRTVSNVVTLFESLLSSRC
jgi:glycosyltransferase involved in cell wall biosynthesis